LACAEVRQGFFGPTARREEETERGDVGQYAAVILAAGKGTRLKSKQPKVLHEAGGRSLLAGVLAAVRHAGIAPGDTYVVSGHGADLVRAQVVELGVKVVTQEPQRGTGHALQVAAPMLRAYDYTLVLNGDMPLLSAGTVEELMAAVHGDVAAAIATAEPESPRAYGRIIREGEFVRQIVEDRQATPAQKSIRELNAGFYCFRTPALLAALEKIGTDNPHREYYLTDTIGVLTEGGQQVAAVRLGDSDEILGVNDRAELAEVDRLLRRRKLRDLMADGVTVINPESVLVDVEVEVGADTVLEPGVQLLGRTRIGEDCRIGSYSIVRDCNLADGVYVRPFCHMELARLELRSRVGPFSRLREGAVIEPEAQVGNFVELKNATLGAGSKALHLAYLGDASIGEGTNIGAGTITCNYDGIKKHRTAIGDSAFVGSNSTLVAPVEIGSGSYVAAGSTIVEAVPQDSLALGRARQVIKPEWAKRRRERTAAERAKPHSTKK
jgi:bifunctional UDP-N-acetylglucosamine pyrophosphorylase/glucosamine-1-phosphate N-acetyltransferase